MTLVCAVLESRFDHAILDDVALTLKLVNRDVKKHFLQNALRLGLSDHNFVLANEQVEDELGHVLDVGFYLAYQLKLLGGL